LLLRYQWPGNIRELKNVAEQLSIMSERRVIDEQDLLEVLPDLNRRFLPAKTEELHSNGDGMQEREILYKLLFDMKSDLNELKALVFGLIRENKLDVPDAQKILSLPERAGFAHMQNVAPADTGQVHHFAPIPPLTKEDESPIILHDKAHKFFDDSDPVDENLS